VEYAVKTVGAEKILFGTDTYSAAFQTGRVAFARISDEDKKKILRDNAIKLFPRAFSDLA
jgi:predicted TIM-barrel fold metal-dependent hydrolase